MNLGDFLEVDQQERHKARVRALKETLGEAAPMMVGLTGLGMAFWALHTLNPTLMWLVLGMGLFVVGVKMDD